MLMNSGLNRGQGMTMANLEAEVATYASKLAELSAQSGKFVLIKGETVIGVYDTYADALKIGYERFGLVQSI